MKNLLSHNKAGPGPGTYSKFSVVDFVKPDYEPVRVRCFFKGAQKCKLCDELLYGDYYGDNRKRKPMCWCLECFRFAIPHMPRTYRDAINKYRHCCFVHKHIDVEDIVYHKMPKGVVRKMFLKEKVMWNKFGEMRDHKGLPF